MAAFDIAILRRHRMLVVVTALQALCAGYFVLDVLLELPDLRSDPLHPLIELVAVAALVVGSALGVAELRRILRRSARAETGLRAASGAFAQVLEESFAAWRLTPSERDVALLVVKGLGVAEIAALRRTQAGTVKAQCASVYRKAGVNSRAELLGLFIEELISGALVDAPPAAAPEAADEAATARLSVALRSSTNSR